MRRAIFLDRDGVLNEVQVIDGIPTPPRSVQEIKIIDGVRESIEILKRNKILIVVVTNQPDVARGKTTRQEVEEINMQIGHSLGIEHFYTCYHDDKDKCKCRKPAPGLIEKAVNDLDINIENSHLVGDRWRDISAGQLAGCKTFFIDYSYPERKPLEPYTRVSSLLEAVNIMLGVESGST